MGALCPGKAGSTSQEEGSGIVSVEEEKPCFRLLDSTAGLVLTRQMAVPEAEGRAGQGGGLCCSRRVMAEQGEPSQHGLAEVSFRGQWKTKKDKHLGQGDQTQ